MTAAPTAGTGPAALTDKGRRTRQRIVEATGRRILASGIGGTTLDDVRAETLTSKSQLFHYFPGGKAELVRAVAEWEGEQLMRAQEPHVHDLSTRASWEAWRSALVDYYIGQGRWACPIGSLATEAAARDPELAATVAGAFGAWADLLAAADRCLVTTAFPTAEEMKRDAACNVFRNAVRDAVGRIR